MQIYKFLKYLYDNTIVKIKFKYIGKYFWNILVSLDQLVNTLLGGDPDETISSRAAKAKLNNKKWGCLLCKLLDRIDPNHCDKYIELDEGKNAVFKQK